MHYTVYKVTNEINGKIYIGCHKTNNLNDGYMGSGKVIRAAIKKYGVDNFEKEIIGSFESEDQMFDEERNLISKLNPEYNLHEGGNGGWSYINSVGLNGTQLAAKKRQHLLKDKEWYDDWKTKLRAGLDRPECREKISKKVKKAVAEGRLNTVTFSGKQHTEETKKRIGEANSKHQIGSGNSRYGTMWITNGKESKSIQKTHAIPVGWRRGRVIKRP